MQPIPQTRLVSRVIVRKAMWQKSIKVKNEDLFLHEVLGHTYLVLEEERGLESYCHIAGLALTCLMRSTSYRDNVISYRLWGETLNNEVFSDMGLAILEIPAMPTKLVTGTRVTSGYHRPPNLDVMLVRTRIPLLSNTARKKLHCHYVTIWTDQLYHRYVQIRAI